MGRLGRLPTSMIGIGIDRSSFSGFPGVPDRGEQNCSHTFRRERPDRLGFAPASIIDALQEIVRTVFLEHFARASYERQIDGVLQRRQDDAESSRPPRSEARRGLVVEVAELCRRLEYFVARFFPDRRGLRNARETVICEKPVMRATSSMVGIARVFQLAAGEGARTSLVAGLLISEWNGSLTSGAFTTDVTGG